MLLQLFYLSVLLTSAFAISSYTCDKLGVLLYEDIGCQPVKNDKTDECASQYNCDFPRTKSGCIFKGKTYNVSDSIDSDLTYSGCSVGCICRDVNSIICAVLDCPEYLGRSPQEGCYPEYELGKCCSIGQICNNKTEEKKTCLVDGRSYEIGSKFYPKDTCLNCVCHENFTEGVYDEVTCMRQNCVTQTRFTTELNQKCAPAYFNFHSDEVLCCPDDFVCPESDQNTILVVNHAADAESSLRCEYGDEKLKLGEGFKRKVNKYGKVRNLACECVLPPLVTCREV